jgi:hypothetical protein
MHGGKTIKIQLVVVLKSDKHEFPANKAAAKWLMWILNERNLVQKEVG